MGHQIEQSADGTQAAFVSAREDAWHHLGTVVDHAMTAQEALELAHLTNWNVRMNPLTTTVNGQELEVPGKFAIVRDNPFQTGQVDVFGVMGKQYTPIQNEEHAAVMEELHDRSGAQFETAGSLYGGTEVFLTMKLPQTMLVGGSDPVDTYIAALNTHHGQKAFRFIVTPTRVVCANTQRVAELDATASFKVRHVAGAVQGIAQQVRDALDITYSMLDDFQKEADQLIDQSYTDRQFKVLTEKLFPVKDAASDAVKAGVERHRAGLVSLWKDSPTAEAIRGTKWGAYQAVTEYADHFVQAKGKQGEVLEQYRAQQAISVGSPLTQLKQRAFAALA